MVTHREGVNPGFLTRFRLGLQSVDPARVQLAAENIKQLAGVDGVWFKPGKAQLKVAYDGSQQNIDGILALLETHGVKPKQSWWSRFRLGMQQQTDQNIRDNANHEAHCCNKVPPGVGRRG